MQSSIAALLSSPIVQVILVVSVLVVIARSWRSRFSLLAAAREDIAQRIQDMVDSGVVTISHHPTDSPMTGAELVELAYLESLPDAMLSARHDATKGREC